MATHRKETFARYEEKVNRFLQHGQLVRMGDEYLVPRERVFANHTTRLGYVDWCVALVAVDRFTIMFGAG